MKEQFYLDTNILLRLLTKDDAVKAARCERLLREAQSKGEKFLLTDLCIAEMVWTLESFYRVSRHDILEMMLSLLNTPCIQVSNLSVMLDAIARFAEKSVDFIDAYHAAIISSSSSAIYSYDRDFDKFNDVSRKKP